MLGLVIEAVYILIVFPPFTTSNLISLLQGKKWALHIFPNTLLRWQGVLYVRSLVSRAEQSTLLTAAFKLFT